VRLGDAVLLGDNSIGKYTTLDGNIEIGYASTLDEQCILRGNVTIGRYCQFGPRVSLLANNHPAEYITTYSNRRLLDGIMKGKGRQIPIRVENDVWIGCGAIILKGVTVKSGAVIGAGSIVTHDVDNYTIVAGNPARVLRKRFGDRIISLLLELQWWDLTLEELEGYRELFTINMAEEPERAVELLCKYMIKYMR